MGSYTRAQVAALVDHTLLKPEATAANIEKLVAEAVDLGVFSVCVSPSLVSTAAGVAPSSLAVAAVSGFPSGKHLAEIKARESQLAVAAGAAEIDMVIDIGLALSGDLDATAAEVAAVRAAIPGAALKVIVESAALLEFAGEALLQDVCRAAVGAGADFVKTSTGFHPSGGASVRAVELMAQAAGDGVGVKASGGIRTAEAATAMLDAGATRLGLSGTRAVLDGFTA
ncbi:deoxyribose-phosphate aldolase [Mycolicibacterium boenickei]|uniref:Deoxyribose-phosphate aldolase n=1 Tax=Mycolicibacterium boenickei TaxID=146017 RepID=A0AAX2ZV39_9MYCO|nr:deoxyribose-phosphate aldolase [Mycolicibacterium boenickei]PEG61173.1 deoxyribose-phosphate aldolase [Mycolicibacterium boenickei]UNB99026.1 deoxyribose-phosphate aldolase [Mycolicibacterium boenickei]BBX88612.1 deoxyribose-phosphate aldolase [Mycolicibacterium boenickei]